MQKIQAFSAAALTCAALAGCGAAVDPEQSEEGASIYHTDSTLTGCHGAASSSIPSSGMYYLTTFGGPGDSQPMSCGSNTNNGTWYYAASRQRYGCRSRIRIEANGRCVVAQTDDYGPDVCVENAAGGPTIDASPMVARYLFNQSEVGWSERRRIKVTKVSSTTKLGPC